MINLQPPLVKSGISYVKSERSRVLKVLQTMAMDLWKIYDKWYDDIMSQYSIIGILHALVSSRARFVNKLSHMILTSTGEKLNDLQTTVKTRSQSAIILVSYNGVHITRSIIGRLRYLVEPGIIADGRWQADKMQKTHCIDQNIEPFVCRSKYSTFSFSYLVKF